MVNFFNLSLYSGSLDHGILAKSKPRFASVTTEELDKISKERNSEKTTQHTKWGVKILQGMWFNYLFLDGANAS